MSNSDLCPICLTDYVSEGAHKPVSLKCGHVFGNSCVLKWFGNSNSAHCPTCAKVCRKRELRIIFGTSLKITDSVRETELCERLLKAQDECRVYKQENSQLKMALELLQQEIDRLSTISKNSEDQKHEFKYNHFKFVRKIRCNTKDSKIAFDPLTSCLFFSDKNSSSLGYKKVDLGVDGFIYVPLFQRNFSCRNLSDISVSPFHDGLILFAYNKTIKLVNGQCNNVILDIDSTFCVKSAVFDCKNRDYIYYAGSGGHLYSYNIFTKKQERCIFIDKKIFKISQLDNKIYCAALENWYYVDLDSWEFARIDSDPSLQCINLFTESFYLLATFRSRKMLTNHRIIKNNYRVDKNNIIHSTNDQFTIFSECLQYKRRNDKIYEDHAFVTNEEQNRIEVFDLNSLNKVDTYKFYDLVIDFFIYKNLMYVITEKFINILAYQPKSFSTQECTILSDSFVG